MNPTIVQHSISARAARSLIEFAAEKATELGVPMSIAVVDQAGTLKSFERMYACPVLAVDIAINKAYTAAAFEMSTDGWYDFVKDDEPLRLSILHTPRLTAFGGGYPLLVDGVVVGGIGLSGGHYSQDMVCAQYALQRLGLTEGN